jgi:hypothetical protein
MGYGSRDFQDLENKWDNFQNLQNNGVSNFFVIEDGEDTILKLADSVLI